MPRRVRDPAALLRRAGIQAGRARRVQRLLAASQREFGRHRPQSASAAKRVYVEFGERRHWVGTAKSSGREAVIGAVAPPSPDQISAVPRLAAARVSADGRGERRLGGAYRAFARRRRGAPPAANPSDVACAGPSPSAWRDVQLSNEHSGIPRHSKAQTFRLAPSARRGCIGRGGKRQASNRLPATVAVPEPRRAEAPSALAPTVAAGWAVAGQ